MKLSNREIASILRDIKNQHLPKSRDFRNIVLNRIPLIDVRAPIEFEKGAFLDSVNLSILSDKERHLIGIKYKNAGNAKAVELGYELVNPHKDELVKAWCNFIKEHPNAMIYCFRGGQRSQISQSWIKEAGIDIVRLDGGYKAFRNYLMQESVKITQNANIVVLGGRTGSGKTLLLKKLYGAVDLEGLANHRGSSFGRFITPQPTQINFENALAYDLIHWQESRAKHLIVEDESRNIGRVAIPDEVFREFKNANVIVLETPMNRRVEITYDEYVREALKNYKKQFGEVGEEMWFNDAMSALDRIKKRLGSQRHKIMSDMFTQTYKSQLNGGSLEGHKEWIEILLREYYDPMYDYQLEQKRDRVLFCGSEEEVLGFGLW